MMNFHDLHRIHLPQTESTNRYAQSLTTATPTLITTDYQTSGRGQRGNSWESEAGKNILFSLIIKPIDIPASRQFILCELISVAICDVLSRYVPDIRIKWPNDIYYRDQKLCGILIEHDLEGSRLSRTIIGVGINVNQAHFASDAPNPVSLRQILGHEVDREALLSSIAAHFFELYDNHISSDATHSQSTLHERYTHRLYRLNIPSTYKDAQGEFIASLRTVAPDGRLILEPLQGEQRSYLFKEVAYLI